MTVGWFFELNRHFKKLDLPSLIGFPALAATFWSARFAPNWKNAYPDCYDDDDQDNLNYAIPRFWFCKFFSLKK